MEHIDVVYSKEKYLAQIIDRLTTCNDLALLDLILRILLKGI